MTPEEFRSAGYAAIDWLVDYLKEIEERPVTSKVEPGEVRSSLPYVLEAMNLDHMKGHQPLQLAISCMQYKKIEIQARTKDYKLFLHRY